jgi:hypothetical protein
MLDEMNGAWCGAVVRFVPVVLALVPLSCDQDGGDHQRAADVATALPGNSHLVRALTTPPLARGIGLGSQVSWDIQSGVRTDGSFARFAVATGQLQDGGFIQVGIVDLEGAAAMTAAGDLTSPEIPELVMTGFKPAARSPGIFYRLNPPGGHFGGEIRTLVGDRFVVWARGERLMMETIADQATRVARALEQARPER